MITIKPKDALRAKVLPPGWQICLVENYQMKTASTDGSTLHAYELVVDEGQFKGVPLNEYVISEKAIGMGKPFFIACGMPEDLWVKAEKGESVQFDEQLPVGKRIRVMVKPEIFGNRTLNKAADFMKEDTSR